MGLLFVHEGDSKAKGQSVNISPAEHNQILTMARDECGGNPLIRRLNNFYADVLFERDELVALHKELSLSLIHI